MFHLPLLQHGQIKQVTVLKPLQRSDAFYGPLCKALGE
ncbi:MAG: hypothetical protein OFPI_18330 [Osedax symbiont Rs2]|nr:MAG: hypothetical protein OFPI_18330 [Osedax symbiont Rs2]